MLAWASTTQSSVGWNRVIDRMSLHHKTKTKCEGILSMFVFYNINWCIIFQRSLKVHLGSGWWAVAAARRPSGVTFDRGQGAQPLLSAP